MFPAFRQRIFVVVAVIIGAVVWCQAAGPLRAGDALSGISLFQAQIGPALAIGLVIAAGIPALVMGLGVAAVGNALSGVFVVAASLTAVAGIGGGVQGFIWRSSLPGGYGWLLGEMLIWLAGLAGVLWLMRRVAPGLGQRLGEGWHHEHFEPEMKFGLPDTEAVIAGLVSVVVGGLLTNVLVQTPAVGQAVGSLIVAFIIGGLIARAIVPHHNPVGILVSPAVVGVAAYAYMLIRYAHGEQILAAYNARLLPGAAMVLPIFYISAGVVGASIGVGLAQAMDHARTAGAEDGVA